MPNDHPVRFVRDFVDALDLREFGIHEPAAEEGRPPYAPDLLLEVWLFGYMERVRSTRALEKACMQVMPFLWLTGNLHPDHDTLWRFFDSHRKALPKLFRRLVKLAAEAELIGFALHALDGTKMTAVSSTDEALHRKSLEEKLEQQIQRQQDPRMRTLLGLRKEIVEHLFGIVKTIDGFRRFTVRGLEKAQAQWALVCLAVNLRKLRALTNSNARRLVPRPLGAEATAAG